MANVIYENKYPNVIVFTSKDYEGVVAAFLVKQKYDNNLQNDLWDRNVQVYFNQGQDLQWFQQKVEQNLVEGQENVVYMLNTSTNPYENILQLWNWCEDKEVTFKWYDHDISRIQNLKHLHIPGKQSSLKSTFISLWQDLNTNVAVPKSLKMLNEVIIKQKNVTFSFDKETYPLSLFVTALGKQINNNKNELLMSNLTQLINSKDQFLSEAMFIGRFINNYQKQRLSDIKQETKSAE